jgi:hypothetical protein
MRIFLVLMAALAGLAGCAGTGERAPADAFMDNLSALCGRSFAGRLVTTDPADANFAGQALVMGAVACNGADIRIPFAVGENRSRIWVISRTPAGLRLKHVHRHDDGTEDAVSRYGGDTIAPGTATRQEFPADEFSKQLFLANKLERSVGNVWAVEIVPGRMFAYELRREGRFFRVEFDVGKPVS